MAEVKNIIFDIDGTLANIDHRKHHIKGEIKDWDSFYSECHNDEIIPQTEMIYRRFAGSHWFRMLIVTGRSEKIRKKTEDWFERHFLQFDEMFMRPDGDYRADHCIKEEVLAKIREKYGEPFIVFEDRKRVVDMWRSNGVHCHQVDDGDF